MCIQICNRYNRQQAPAAPAAPAGRLPLQQLQSQHPPFPLWPRRLRLPPPVRPQPPMTGLPATFCWGEGCGEFWVENFHVISYVFPPKMQGPLFSSRRVLGDRWRFANGGRSEPRKRANKQRISQSATSSWSLGRPFREAVSGKDPKNAQKRLQTQEETPRKQGDTMCIIVIGVCYRCIFSESRWVWSLFWGI